MGRRPAVPPWQAAPRVRAPREGARTRTRSSVGTGLHSIKTRKNAVGLSDGKTRRARPLESDPVHVSIPPKKPPDLVPGVFVFLFERRRQ